MSTELSEAPKRAAGALGALAERLDIEPKRMSEVLKATAFKACKNDEQFAALIIVANTYGLNPLLKELYAFPGRVARSFQSSQSMAGSVSLTTIHE